MHNFETLGFIAGLLETASLAPQLVKAYKTRSTDDISLQWLMINICSQLLWTIYGFIINGIALFIMSGITLALSILLLLMKFKFDKKKSIL